MLTTIALKMGLVFLTLNPLDETIAVNISSIQSFYGTPRGCHVQLTGNAEPFLVYESCEEIEKAITKKANKK